MKKDKTDIAYTVGIVVMIVIIIVGMLTHNLS